MSDIRINSLPSEPNPSATDNLAIDGATTRRATAQAIVNAGAPVASQAEAQAGTDAVKRMTPLTTKQSIASEVGVTIAGPLGPNLTGIQALTTAANKVPIFTNGSGGSTTYTVSPFVQTASAAIDSNTFLGAIGVVQTPTRAIVQSLTIPADVKEIFTLALATPGDGGGAQYTRVVSEPSHTLKVRSVDRFLPNGSVDAVNGGWWVIAETEINVKMAGAGVGGDDTLLFGAAAQAAPSLDTLGPPNNTSTVPRAPTASVIVPDGEYTLSDVVDAGNKFVTWIVSPGAKINGADFINGRVTVEGLNTINGNSFGILDDNVSLNVVLGGGYGKKPGPVAGVSSVAALADYAQIDAVALAACSYSRPPLLTVTSGFSYTTTTLTITGGVSDAVRKRLRKGQAVATTHAAPYLGVIDSWATVGSDTVITLGDGGWYLRGSGGLGPQTPANTDGCLIDVVEKIWPQNLVLNLTADGSANSGIGSELSLRNLGKPSGTNLDSGSRTWGYGALAVAYDTPGFQPSQVGFIARGWFHYGFAAQDQNQGYRYQTIGAGKTAFFARMPFAQTALYVEDTTNGRRYRINASGDTEHGDPAVATGGGRSISFHTSGLASAFDTRISATGGTATQGQGTLTYSAIDNVFGGVVRPGSDNVRTLGNASFRWSQLFAGTATINTSDERLKTDIETIPDEWLDAWGDVEWCRYRWKDAVAEKGDGARWHLGLIAQRVHAAFSQRGINAETIGLVCLDPVLELETVTTKEERTITEQYEDTDFVDDVVDGQIVRRQIVVTRERPKTVMMDVVNDNGDPVMEEVLDPDAHDQRKILVPMRRAMPLTEMVEVSHQVERPTGEMRYGLRYTEAFAIEAAWTRRELLKKQH